MKKLVSLLSLLVVVGCSEQTPQPLLYTVEQQEFAVEIPAQGELFAAKATVIGAPPSRRGGQTLAWLAPEYSYVKKGDIVAKFDGEAMSKNREEKRSELDMTLQDIIDKSGQLNKELTDINKDIDIVEQEKEFADRFAIEDERILSKLEILESMQDSQYLGTKQDYLQWKGGSFSESAEGEMSILEMQKKQHQSRLNILDSSLSNLEIKAPHDGMLVYASNWRGEKARPGQMYWPGQKIAELPDINVMKAKLFVPEKEAIDLAAGVAVSIQVNADVEESYQGEIETISAYPSSISRGDPQKFFEVVVKLNKPQNDLFVPGRKVTAKIHVKPSEKQLVVPLQAVFSKDNQQFVWQYKNGEFAKTPVTLGQTSLSHAVIEKGLTAGEKISLIERGAS